MEELDSGAEGRGQARRLHMACTRAPGIGPQTQKGKTANVNMTGDDGGVA